MEKKPGKEAMGFHSEKPACPRRGSIQAQQHALFGVVVSLAVGLDSCDCLTEFRSVRAVAGVSKRAEPLMGMSLQNRCASTHDFPAFASSVARGAEGAQTAHGRWPIGGHR
jgi:hypothetical protein